MEQRTRNDIVCPKTGEPIPLDKLSICKWSDKLYLVHCPTCRVMHEFDFTERLSDAKAEL